MKIVFRLNFTSVPGQSLWLKLATVIDEKAVRIEKVLPLRWINDGQWEVMFDIHAGGALRLEYFYQMRQEWNEVTEDEWTGMRSAVVDPATHDALFLRDTWCAADRVDFAFDSHAMKAVLPTRGPFVTAEHSLAGSHRFQLRMAAVPLDCVPCLVGSVSEIGGWDWAAAVPMQEVAANVWQTHLQISEDVRIEYKYGLFDPKTGCATDLEAGANRVLGPHQFSKCQWTHVNDENYRWDADGLYRGAGVAVPVFSLRSELSLGVGEFADLKTLADWAVQVGLKLIQILPVNDTTSSQDWTDSYPYSAISAFALHPIYLRIQDLGYVMPVAFTLALASARESLNSLEYLDYEQVMKEKSALARQVFDQHRQAIGASEGFLKFLTANRDWLVPYAVFCVKRDHFGTADFSLWQDWEYFDRERADAMAEPNQPEWPMIFYHLWVQYELDLQLADAVSHLHQRGLALKGDLPIGIDRHSVDAWSLPHLFKLDAQAGAPPDAFARKGQNWGFPTYDWQRMREDDYAWWRSRFAQLSHYFDAYRVDHILGFFRIWQIPNDHVEGIMGSFDPAVPVHIDEIRDRGIPFDRDRYCQPYIREHFLWERFGDTAQEVKDGYLDGGDGGVYQLRAHVATQRKIVDWFASLPEDDAVARIRLDRIRAGLLDCASDVLFFEVPGSDGTLFHPRCSMQATRSFQELGSDTQWQMDELYMDYFYRRQEGFWEQSGNEKLPVIRRASPMLLCGEDLGMVPACVPGVLHALGILSLEIQRMPKHADMAFSDPAHAPYMSVVSTSTHDMSNLRGWWREDKRMTANFAWQMLGEAFPEAELSGALAARIILQHLMSPAMWAIFPIQDLLAMDESIRHEDPDAERINVPSVKHHKWSYRMHLRLEQLAAADAFNGTLTSMLQAVGRV